MNKLIIGVIAGLVATVPMTLAMKIMHRSLPPEEQHPLPPREVTMEIADEVGLRKHLSESQRRKLTICNTRRSLCSSLLSGIGLALDLGVGESAFAIFDAGESVFPHPNINAKTTKAHTITISRFRTLKIKALYSGISVSAVF